MPPCLFSAILRSVIAAAGAGIMLMSLVWKRDFDARQWYCFHPVHPPLTVWAWDHPDDLRFLKGSPSAVAYYAGTISMRQNMMVFSPRHKSLELPSGQDLCPVFRIENCSGVVPPAKDADEITKIVRAYLRTKNNLDHCSVQIDYDATINERPFYLLLLNKLRRNLPSKTHIAITALASWALEDRWLPPGTADEAVIMLFSMGNANQIWETIGERQLSLGTGIDTSIGISVNEPLTNDRLSRLGIIQKAHRLYIFNSFPWTRNRYLEVTRLINN